MRSHSRVTFIGVFFVIFTIILGVYPNIEAHADALSTAPQGISMDNDWFKTPDKSQYTNGSLLSSDILPNNDSGTGIVKITDSTGQAGGIWGNPDKKNYISTTKAQKLSMWINISKVSGVSSMGDGLAFVLQNDSRGTNAMSSYQSNINTGQTLGVWGVDSPFRTSSAPESVAATAIQNSWALEFDMHSNHDTPSYDNALDTKSTYYDYSLPSDYNRPSIDTPHIASAFPAQASTYQSTVQSAGFLKKSYYYTMNHRLSDDTYNDVTTNLLNTQNWMHLTITIDYPNKKITYIFNDKNPDGTATASGRRVKDTVSFTNQFGTITDDKLLYGFTGSTGDAAENGLVIFEQIPGFLQAETTPKFVDLTMGGKELTQKSDYAYDGDEVVMNYNLKYVDGNEPWKGITTHIPVPAGLILNPKEDGSIGQVTIGDKIEKIPASSYITDSTSPDNGKVVYSITNTMGSDDASQLGQVTLYTKAKYENANASDHSVSSVHARFVGSNAITDADSPAFTIKEPEMKLESSSDNPMQVSENKDATIDGQVSYVDSSKTVDNSKMTVHTKLNDGDEKTYTMNTSDPVGQLAVKIAAADLEPSNKLILYVSDSDGNRSNSLTFIITVKGGSLELVKYPAKVSFQSVNGDTAKGQILHRVGDWSLTVSDTRGENDHWYLTAEATDLYGSKTGKPFNGTMLYVGKDTKKMTNNEVTIADGTVGNDVDTEEDIDWTNADKGILMRADGSNTADTYTGKIYWNLTDSIPNDI